MHPSAAMRGNDEADPRDVVVDLDFDSAAGETAGEAQRETALAIVVPEGEAAGNNNHDAAPEGEDEQNRVMSPAEAAAMKWRREHDEKAHPCAIEAKKQGHPVQRLAGKGESQWKINQEAMMAKQVEGEANPTFFKRIVKGFTAIHHFAASTHTTHLRDPEHHAHIQNAKQKQKAKRRSQNGGDGSQEGDDRASSTRSDAENATDSSSSVTCSTSSVSSSNTEKSTQGSSDVPTDSEEGDEDAYAELKPSNNPYFAVGFPIAQIIIFHLSNSAVGIDVSPGSAENCGENKDFCPPLLDQFAQEWWADKSCSNDGCAKVIDQRGQVWRWFSYCLVHVDFDHVYFNCFFELLLGPSLEMVHGHVRFIPLCLLCVLGGALACGASDATGRVVGSSAYVWGLVPMHMSSVILNWPELGHTHVAGMPENWFRMCLISLLGLTMAWSMADDIAAGTGVSHAAHAGGFAFGLFFSLNFVKNAVPEHWETQLQKATLVGAVVYTIVCIILIAMQNEEDILGNKEHCACCAKCVATTAATTLAPGVTPAVTP
ncbi:unnamed protein product [Amoebophrya sp. A25]|nr:unnamed protein product [Amoebophrya sp. A25]|eukprot:GSA25T00019069001.1